MKRLLLATTLLGACSMEPRYDRPAPAIRPALPAVAEGTGLPSLDRRVIFRDAALQRVLDRALANSQDLKEALANIEVARGQYRVARAQRFPDLGISGGAAINDRGGGGQGGINGNGGGAIRSYNIQGGASAFELDLFGRLRSLSNAALDEYLATAAGARAARLTLVGDTASAWLTLAADRSLLAIAIDTEASAGRSVQITRARLQGGISPRTELRQAETVLAQAAADRADLTAQVAQDRNALERLTGASVPDTDLPASIEAVDGGLVPVPAGLDSRVLLRRPDVVQAEYVLRAANARIGAARAAFFPTLSLTATAGYASTALASLFTGGAFAWTVSGNAAQSIFDFGGRRGDLAAARGRFDVALAQYQQTIQTAFQEVSDALARRAVIGDQFGATARLEAAARDTFILSEARYREGIDPYLNTLDAQRTLYNARRQLAQARLTRADNLVDLYRTIGGDELTDTVPRAEGRVQARPQRR